MTLAKQYYVDGYVKIQLKNAERLYAVLESLCLEKPRDGFEWIEKYPNTLDLRPTAHLYDATILETLYKAEIPSLLNDVVGSDFTLFHTQIETLISMEKSL